MTTSTNNYSKRQVYDFVSALINDRTLGKRVILLKMDNGAKYKGPKLHVATTGGVNLVPYGIYLLGLTKLSSGQDACDVLPNYLPLNKIHKISVRRTDPSGDSLLHRLSPAVVGRILEYLPFPQMYKAQADRYLANALTRNEYPLIPFAHLEQLNRLNSEDRPMTYSEYKKFEQPGAMPLSFPQIYHLSLSGPEITNERLREIVKKFPNLQSLDLSGCRKITNLSCLAGRPIEYLNLDNTQITDVGLSTLPALPLQNLNLRDAKITDIGLVYLVKYPTLQHLNLQKCLRFSDAGVARLKDLPNLQYLDFFLCKQLTNQALGSLGQIPTLLYLSLGNDNITDRGLRHLSTLTNLQCVDLTSCTQITDLSSSHLETLHSLKHVNLSGCGRLTDTTAMRLTTLPELKRLTLQYCYQVTDAAKAHLQTRGILNEPFATLPWGNNKARLGRMYMS